MPFLRLVGARAYMRVYVYGYVCMCDVINLPEGGYWNRNIPMTHEIYCSTVGRLSDLHVNKTNRRDRQFLLAKIAFGLFRCGRFVGRPIFGSSFDEAQPQMAYQPCIQTGNAVMTSPDKFVKDIARSRPHESRRETNLNRSTMYTLSPQLDVPNSDLAPSNLI